MILVVGHNDTETRPFELGTLILNTACMTEKVLINVFHIAASASFLHLAPVATPCSLELLWKGSKK